MEKQETGLLGQGMSARSAMEKQESGLLGQGVSARSAMESSRVPHEGRRIGHHTYNCGLTANPASHTVDSDTSGDRHDQRLALANDGCDRENGLTHDLRLYCHHQYVGEFSSSMVSSVSPYLELSFDLLTLAGVGIGCKY